jgi:UDP-2-acetamido-2,6-beta-L-arabino-hexul-4-ose reductase
VKIAVTGAQGFLGWHLRAALVAQGLHEVVPIGREDYATPTVLAMALEDCDAVVHLAGVNRGPEADVEEGNTYLARALAAALEGSRVRVVVFGNSIHSGTDSAFGRSKAVASAHLARTCEHAGIAYTDVVLPNIFGEGGRPRYNSFVATFCAELTEGREPVVDEDRQLSLLAAQDAADVLIAAVERRETTELRPRGQDTSVVTVLETLREMTDYPATGEFPDLSTPFRVALFNTFQSFCFPHRFPIDRAVHSDPRGYLFEGARARCTDTLSFVSSTHPGAVRGQHFHRRKIERFLVVEGEAEISLRKVAGEGEIAFRVSGRRPQAVDMPTLWAHAIKNVGTSTLLTVFWTNELLNAAEPDTYRYCVYAEEGEAA